MKQSRIMFTLVAMAIALTACTGYKENEKTIPYEVLKKVDSPFRGDDRFTMEILVSGAASRQEVMNLAESLRQKCSGHYIAIDIFDSREASEARYNAGLSGQALEGRAEEEFWRHFLVEIGGVWSDGQEIHWVAEGRDH